VPGGTELYMGTAALSERDYVHEAVERADLIVTIGHDTVEKPPFIMAETGRRSSTLDISRRTWNRCISLNRRSSAIWELRCVCSRIA